MVIKDITGQELANKLLVIHSHAGLLLKFDLPGKEEDYLKNPSQIVYTEQDIVNLLEGLGLPTPIWEED